MQELPSGNLAFVESNKLTVRYHEIPVEVVNLLKTRLCAKLVKKVNLKPSPLQDPPVFSWSNNKETDIGGDWTETLRAPVLTDLRSGNLI